MPAAPLFRRGDSAYIKSSTGIGRLDSYTIGNSRFVNGKWAYQIHIGKKPPHQQTVGDGWDKRYPEPDLFYIEDELTTLCDAIDRSINEMQLQIASIEKSQTTLCGDITTDLAPNLDPDGPKFEIGEEVFLDVSARLGFFMSAKITNIFEVGIQPGSRKTKYVYTTDLRHTSSNETLYHRENEFITKCETFPKVLSNLNGQLTNLLVKRNDFCSSI